MAELTDGTAELRVLVTTALGALPLENAIVSVSTAPDETGMRTLLYSVTTDSVPTMLPVALTPLAENQSFAQTDLTATGAPQALDPELPENP